MLLVLCILFIVIIIIIFFLVNQRQNGELFNKEPYRIVQFSCDKDFSLEIMKEITNTIGTVGLFNLSIVESEFIKKMSEDLKNPPVKNKKGERNINNISILNLNILINRKISFISKNSFDITENNTLFSGYKAALIKKGDGVFLRNFYNTVDDKEIEWFSDKQFIKDRTKETTFLKEKLSTTINSANFVSKLIIMRYLIDNDNAIHVNFITNNLIDGETCFKSFVGFLKYIKEYIKTYNIAHFSIAGTLQYSSVKRNKFIQAVFNEMVYISPSTEKKFYQSCNIEENNCPDFIIISKSLAPHGVNFFLTEIPFVFIPNKFVLVAEIKKNKKDVPLPFVDKTVSIYKQILKNKRIRPDTKMDLLKSDNVSLEDLVKIPKMEYEANNSS